MKLQSLAGGFINSGGIIANQALKIETKLDITNENNALIKSTNKLDIKSEDGGLINAGLIKSKLGTGSLNINKAIENTGIVQTLDNKLKIVSRTGGLVNSGNILVKQDLTIKTETDVHNIKGALDSEGDIKLKSLHGEIKNEDGTIIALKNLNIEAEGNISNLTTDPLNPSYLKSTEQLNITSRNGSFINSGNSSSLEDRVYLSAQGVVINGGTIQSARGKELSINSNELRNKGKVDSLGKMKLEIIGNIENDKGQITSVHALSIKSYIGSFVNQGERPQNNEKFKLGVIFSEQSIIINTKNEIKNINGLIETPMHLDIISDSAGVTNEGIISGGKTNVTAENTIVNEGEIEGKQELRIKNINQNAKLKNTGKVIADVLGNIEVGDKIYNSGIITAKISLDISANELKNTSQITASERLNINIKNSTINSGTIQSEKLLELTANKLENTGIINSVNENVNIRINENISNLGGTIEAAEKLFVESKVGGLTNTGTIKSYKETEAVIAKNINNSADGIIKGASVLTIRAAKLENKDQAKIISGGVANINIDNNINNSVNAAISSKQNLTLISNNGELINSSKIISEQAAELTISNKINNQGIIQSKELLKLVSTNNGIENSGLAHIASLKSNIIINVKEDVNNAGIISNSGSLQLTTPAALNNSGGILSIQDAVISSANVNNSGVIQSNNILTIQTNDTVINNASGLINAGADLKINAKAGIENKSQGKIKVLGSFNVATDGGFCNFGIVDVENVFKLTGFAGNTKAANMNNQGNIKLNGPVNISLNGDFINNSIIQNNDAVTITANNIQNNSTLSSAGNFIINAYNSFTNNGVLNTNVGTLGNIDIKAVNIVNSGKLNASGELIINAGAVSNKGELIGENRANITVSGLFDNSKQIQSRDNISINSTQFINNGVIKSQGLTVKSNSFSLEKGVLFGTNFIDISSNSGTTNKGILLSKGIVKANISNGNFVNENLIVGGSGIDIFTGHNLINKSNINSKGTIKITANNNIENQAHIVADGALTLTAQNGYLMNEKQISSNDLLTLSAKGDIINKGLITSYSSALFKGKDLINHSTIQAKQGLKLEQTGNLINTGRNIYAGSIILNIGGYINNNQGRIISVGDLIICSQGNILNVGGVISNISRGNLVINSQNINNSRHAATKTKAVDPSQISTIRASGGDGSLKKMLLGHRLLQKNQGLQPDEVKTGYFAFELGEQENVGQRYDKTNEAIYREQLQRTNEPNSIISSNGSITINTSGTINNISGNIVASGGDIILNGGQLLNSDIVANQYNRKTTYYSLKHKEKTKAGPVRGDPKIWYERWNDASRIETTIIDRVPSLIQAQGAIIGSLAGSVNPDNISPHSGGGKALAPYSQALNLEGSATILDETEPATIYAANSSNATSINYPPLTLPAAVNLPEIANTRSMPVTPPIPREQYNMADFTVVIPEPRAPGRTGNFRVPTITPLTLQNSLERPIDSTAILPVEHRLNDVNITLASLLSPQDLFRSAVSVGSSTPLTIRDVSLSNENIAQMIEHMAARSRTAYPNIDNPIQPNINALLHDPELMEVFESSHYTPPTPPGRYYITETSPVFTDFAKYHSTDDFIKRIPHYDPRKEYFHAGDALHQKLLIDNQIHSLTGLALLGNYQNSMDQIKHMYNSSARFASDLHLTPGVRLSKEQLAILREDIIWPEFMRMEGGQEVLVPKVYLGKSGKGERFSGMIADQIQLQASSINNPTNIAGRIVDLTATEGDITNEGRLLASSMMTLDASGLVRNIGGHLESKGGLRVRSSGLINQRLVTNYDLGRGNFYQEAGSAGKIIAGGLFEGYISGDMVNIGSVIEAGRAKLEIGGDFVEEAVSLGEKRGHGRNVSSQQTYIGSRFLVGGDLAGHIKGDLAILGSTIELRGNNRLRVDGNTTIADLVGFRHNERVRDLRGKEVYNLDYEEHVTEAGIIAKGRNIVDTRGDVVIRGGRFTGSTGSSISGANISLLATVTQSQHAEEVKKGNIFMDTHISKGNYSKEVKPVEISKGVSINSRGDINIEIEAGKKPGWLSMLEGRENINITEIKRENRSWDRKTRQLTPEAQVVIAAAVTAATGGAGSTLGAGFAGSAVAAGVSGFASSLVIGSVNNGGNVIKGMKSATSKDNLRSLGKNMLTAGVISGISVGTGFGDVAGKAEKFGVAGRNQAIFERVLLRTGVNSAIMGGDIRDHFKREALHGALAVGQGYIGDIGQRYGFAEGGVAKIAMHSALGAGYALASGGNAGIGALAGGMAEALSGVVNSNAAKHEFSGTGSSGTGLSNWIDL